MLGNLLKYQLRVRRIPELYKMISFNKALRFSVFILFGIILFLLGGCQNNNIETQQTLLSESKNMPKIESDDDVSRILPQITISN